MAINPGIQLEETQTQTGDPTTTLKTVDVPDNSAFWLEVYHGAFSDDGSTKRSATWRRLYRGIKSGGTIDQLNLAKDGAGNDESEFTNEQGALFGDAALTVSANGSGSVNVDGDSPEFFLNVQSNTSSARATQNSSILRDANGVLHAFRTKSGEVVHWDSQSGTASTVSLSSISDPDDVSATVDSNNVIHLAVWEGGNQDILYTSGQTGSWDSEELLYSFSTYPDTRTIDIDLDENDIPWVIFTSTGDSINLYNRVGGSWASVGSVTADNLVGGEQVSLFVDSSTNIGISWNRDSNDFFEIAIYDGSTLTKSQITTSFTLDTDPNDLSYSGSDWLVIAATFSGPILFKGTPGAGFDEIDLFSISSASSFESSLRRVMSVAAGSGFNIAAFQADGQGSTDPGDIYVLSDRDGAWSEERKIVAGDSVHTFQNNDGEINVLDDNPDTFFSFSVNQLSETITHKTGTQVLNG